MPENMSVCTVSLPYFFDLDKDSDFRPIPPGIMQILNVTCPLRLDDMGLEFFLDSHHLL